MTEQNDDKQTATAIVPTMSAAQYQPNYDQDEDYVGAQARARRQHNYDQDVDHVEQSAGAAPN